MNIKHYLTAILIFATIFLSGISIKAQDSMATITIKGRGFGYAYYQNGKSLNMAQLAEITRDTKEAFKYIIKADNYKIAGIAFGAVGGGCVGYSLGYLLGCSMVGQPVELKKFLPFLVAGAGGVVCSIAFDAGSKDKVRQGVEIYNNSIKQKNNANLDVGFSPNGLMLQLNF